MYHTDRTPGSAIVVIIDVLFDSSLSLTRIKFHIRLFYVSGLRNSDIVSIQILYHS